MEGRPTTTEKKRISQSFNWAFLRQDTEQTQTININQKRILIWKLIFKKSIPLARIQRKKMTWTMNVSCTIKLRMIEENWAIYKRMRTSKRAHNQFFYFCLLVAKTKSRTERTRPKTWRNNWKEEKKKQSASWACSEYENAQCSVQRAKN